MEDEISGGSSGVWVIMGKGIVAGSGAFVKVLKKMRIPAELLLPVILLVSCADPSGSLASKDLEAEAHKALLSGNPSRAVRIDREALARTPGDVALMNNLAVALDRSGKKREAERVLRDALRKHPDTPALLLNMARMELSLGQVGSAYGYASRIIARDNWPGGFRTLMGKIDIDRGDYREAHLYLHEAQERHPDNPLILTYLGIVHYRLGDAAEGKKNFRSALRRHPSKGLTRTLESLLENPQKVLGASRINESAQKETALSGDKGRTLSSPAIP